MARSPCRLLRIDLGAPGEEDVELRGSDSRPRRRRAPVRGCSRIGWKRIIKRLAKLAQRAQVSCYRLYDADMPEYAFAIDRYEADGGAVHLQVQEYAPRPASMPMRRDAGDAKRWSACPGLLADCAGAHSSATAQAAERQPISTSASRRERRPARQQPTLTVEEGGLKFLVNLDDYLTPACFSIIG